jgi:hypothetical protein
MIIDLEKMGKALDHLRKFRDIGDAEMLMVLGCFEQSGEHDTVHFCETHKNYEPVCKKYLERFKMSDGISPL